MKKLLVDSGVELSKALCEHFEQSRAELFEIVASTGIRTFSGLLARYGTGTGCEICKPTVASILASTSSDHVLDGEQAALQDSNDHFLANIQKNGTYSVVPRMPGGEVTAEQLIVIGQVAQDFGLYVKVTAASASTSSAPASSSCPPSGSASSTSAWSRGRPTASRCAP